MRFSTNSTPKPSLLPLPRIHNHDEELFIHANGVVWSAGQQVRKRFSGLSAVLQAVWCRFPSIVEPHLCILYSDSLAIFTPAGEMTIIPLPHAVASLWPIPAGLFFQQAPIENTLLSNTVSSSYANKLPNLNCNKLTQPKFSQSLSSLSHLVLQHPLQALQYEKDGSLHVLEDVDEQIMWTSSDISYLASYHKGLAVPYVASRSTTFYVSLLYYVTPLVVKPLPLMVWKGTYLNVVALQTCEAYKSIARFKLKFDVLKLCIGLELAGVVGAQQLIANIGLPSLRCFHGGGEVEVEVGNELRGKKVTGAFIYRHIRQAIKEIGQSNVIQEEFWQEVKGLAMVVLPLYKVLRMTDMEGSTIGLLYHFMEEAYKEIERSTILDGAPDGSRRSIHGFAALLHLTFKKPSIFGDQALQEERDKHLPKILNEEHHGEFLQELINYGDQRGTAFASSVCWNRDSLVKPLFWWECFGYQLPHLQRVALRVLGQDCSSGACERNWSAYSLIHTKICNKLSMKQLEKLIYCRSTLRMLRSMHEMPMARHVNVDECKLSIETLKSLNKDHDPKEEQIFRNLYLELEEIDRRVSRTQSHKKTPRTYVRRGSGSGSTMADTTLENVSISRPTDPREPEFDDEGNILSEGDYGLASSAFDASSDEDDAATSSSSSSSSSDHNSGDKSYMST
ncbi:hypothetical protein GOP47_0001829 [Adiantum capillus-veneris]|uniref:HAT C-terminal dimerisation domain-containing protein n=1 Tax=Adiantum capillus-veneris TaxID=13818 RepID=A0A9D4VAB5_ADICA|nr:hypothetical protein GOP47_0001829 [Adiantum capillus-veneris]